MSDPVFASDGFMYGLESIELLMKGHVTSPAPCDLLAHPLLVPDLGKLALASARGAHNRVAVQMTSVAQSPALHHEVAGGGAAVSQVYGKRVAMCGRHPMEQLPVFCLDCGCAVCVMCAVDTTTCKHHSIVAFASVLNGLTTEREEWVRAQQECRRGAAQLCDKIQADADAKKQAIDTETATLKMQVLAASDSRAFTMGAIGLQRQLRGELVTAAAASHEIFVKGSIAATILAAAVARISAPVPSASAADFCAAPQLAGAVGQVIVADAVVDPESQQPYLRHAASSAEDALRGNLGCDNQLWMCPQDDAYLRSRWQARSAEAGVVRASVPRPLL